MNVDFSENCTGNFKLSLPVRHASPRSVSLKQFFLQRIEFAPTIEKPFARKSDRFLHFCESSDSQDTTIIVEEEIPDLFDN